MVTVIFEDEQISVPAEVVDLDSFRRWTDSPDFPENGRIWWLCGEVWADMSKQQSFTHLLIKAKFNVVLGGLSEVEKPGLFLPDGLLLSNYEADISGNPDATFISNDTLQSDRVRLIEGAHSGYVELQGSPDMVLEVVSESSRHKDQVVLREAYWKAGIPEYWLVNALVEPLRFDVYRHRERGYVAARKQDGWVRSEVFGKSFRLLARTSAAKHPDYVLEVR